MARIPKGFISLGSPNSWINIDFVDKEKTYLDKRINKVAIIDVHGCRFNVDPKLVDGKIIYRT